MTETDVVACPKCNGVLVSTSNGYLRCVQCDYKRSAVKRVLSQAELLRENEKLKKQINKLTQQIQDLEQDMK